MKRISLALLCCMYACSLGYGTAQSAQKKMGSTDDSSSQFHYKHRTGQGNDDIIEEHLAITDYQGPETCIGCHPDEAQDALESVHMQWNGPTPNLVNTLEASPRGKANKGINTFCTYAMSSGSICFTCHVRSDGNAPDEATIYDVDCLMCHNELYKRKFVLDEENPITVTTYDGEKVTYSLAKTDEAGNYITEPDFENMPAGTTLDKLAQTVHLPTRKSCLSCHAKSGGGDWTKRGDMGMSSAAPDFEEDVHLSPAGADLHCTACHADSKHKIGGRGIDLRQTETEAPTCKACHDDDPHSESDLNRHAQGQVSCQVCHIRQFAKGGATEVSRDWLVPVPSDGVMYGQGGYVGDEDKQGPLSPEYVWFNGNSYVYNTGEQISAGENGVYHMAYAIGQAFDGSSSIVPIKRHSTTIAFHEASGQIIPPAINLMFMTGDFDQAVRQGMLNHDFNGTYKIIEADAEMLITHGVEPTDNAPSCNECHDFSGNTPDDSGLLPLTSLGYHQHPESVANCTLCHEPENVPWQEMHEEHRDDIACAICHSAEPGEVKDDPSLCTSCHDEEEWEDDSHEEHAEEGVYCANCHDY